MLDDLPRQRASARPLAAADAGGVSLAVYDDLAAVAPEWRALERDGDCTVFQSLAWIEAWNRHIGTRAKIAPIIVAGRRPDGTMLFLLPLALHPGRVRRLTWLGSDLGDYNAPLLAPDFARHCAPGRFAALWRDIVGLLQRQPATRHDMVEFEKMPDVVGAQPNPFLELRVGRNPNASYYTLLSGSWDEFYAAKRSSATRARQRTKLHRLGNYGEVRFVTPQSGDETARTLEILIAQKAGALARLGIANFFTRPGYREFFSDIATNPATRDLVHLSRLDIGEACAAANLGLIFRGCYHHVIASYGDGPWARFGPGAAHLHELLRYALDRGLAKFDFTIGDEPYKLEWYDGVIRLHDHVETATLPGMIAAAATVTRRSLTRTIKQTPILWHAFRRLRAALARAFQIVFKRRP